MTIRHSKYILIAAWLLIFSGLAQAQAYCALRDPKAGIFELYPQADNYRSIVRTVDESAKQGVEERLPPQTLHFSELGRHTLYVALEQEKPLGFVHVRSEESRWGLVEIAWALDLDLRIIDFKFQRCRSSQKRYLEDESFRAQLRGKSFDDLIKLLKPGTGELSLDAITVPAGAEELAQVLLLCGLKTTLVTELAWKDDIDEIRLLATAKDAFGNYGRIMPVNNPLTEDVRANLVAALQGASLGVKPSSIKLSKVYGSQEKLLGSLYQNITNIDGQHAHLLWAIDAENYVRQIINANGWESTRNEEAFQALLGRRFDSADHCSTRVELLALEAVITANH